MLPGPSSLTWSVLQHATAPVAALALIAATSAPVPSSTTGLRELPDRAATLEVAALELAHELRAVPADGTEQLCERDDLRLRWTEPSEFTHGAHAGRIGPRPDAATVAVNGAVVCGDSTWAYMGFEASWTGADWAVTAVPYLEESHGDVASLNLDADPEDVAAHEAAGRDDADHEHAGAGGNQTAAGTRTVAATASSPAAPTASVATSEWLAGLGTIEPYAAYDPQTSCTSTARPGTVVMRDTLLGVHTGTRNLGILRGCHIGGRSEHKEGRAFDWGAYVSRPLERAAVERFVAQLLATDADGNTHALARRMGVMYLVWNGRIWSSYRASEGWRSYNGPNPHTDHIHISLSRAGGEGRTSFFTQSLAGRGVLGLVPPGASTLPSGAGPVATTPAASPSAPRPGSPQPTRSTSPTTTPGVPAANTERKEPRPGSEGNDGRTSVPAPRPASTPTANDNDQAEDRARRAAEEARKAEERQRKAAEEQERREAEAQRRAEEQERREAEAQRRAEEQQRRAAEQQRREQEHRLKAEAREAERKQAKEQRQKASPAGGAGKGGKGGNGRG